MKSSLGKLRNFALHKSDAKEKSDHQTAAHLDELAQASQESEQDEQDPLQEQRHGGMVGSAVIGGGNGILSGCRIRIWAKGNRQRSRSWSRYNDDGEGFGVMKWWWLWAMMMLNVLAIGLVSGEGDTLGADMHDMRNCYDSLLSAAAATANSAYEFSESLQEMGTCLMEKTALNDDGETGTVLALLGKLQLELQKLVDSYRSHIVLTITNPSESLLSELRKVEVDQLDCITNISTIDNFACTTWYGFLYFLAQEMKLQCDEKREIYDYMVAQHREKGRSKGGKGETFTSQQLKEARDEYDDVARLCIFRMKSLKQGQCRSLLTQAARHHAAQLNFFQKGLKSVEAADPHIRLVAKKQHIDYQFSGLNETEEGEGGSFDTYDTSVDGELSFDYRDNKQGLDNDRASRISMEVSSLSIEIHWVSFASCISQAEGFGYIMELLLAKFSCLKRILIWQFLQLDRVDVPYAQASKLEETEMNFNRNQGEQVFTRQNRAGSYSAPLYPEKFDPAERIKEMKPSARKFHTHVLPTPADAKNSVSGTSTSVHWSLTSLSGNAHNPRHSSPLDTEKHGKHFADDNLVNSISKPRESNSNNSSVQLPHPLSEGLSLPQYGAHNVLDTKKNKRQAFSGPIPSKPWSTKPSLSSSGPLNSTELPQLVSGLLSRVPIPHLSTSPNVSRSASPPPVSSPKISELHELPRPPASSGSKPASSSGVVGHSGPLIFRNQELSPTNRNPVQASHTASRLPAPPSTVSRSFSIPSSNQRAMALHVSKLLESPQVPDREVASPPLTPISISNTQSLSTVAEVVSGSGQLRGGS
ncbi:hypothetical protein RJ640_028177 [Escallonia rubra]|uniref:Hydroxyproline-rich glycoprotein family protein n=1 Tax=Escallonia rubra TaxID=112253 RepID=A0AA88QNW7_9ASTE|nr:hypothetical protein RJ640_028177 [Escallonia rubra]